MGPGHERVEHEPWLAVWSTEGPGPAVQARLDELRERLGATFGERAYVAEGATVIGDELHLGDRSFIAAGCLVRDRVRIGADCSVNAHATIAGKVEIGDAVRIASHAALFGFNHVFDDLDTPIWLQGTVEEGIVVEDDVWIGTHAVVVDGVRVGAHSVVAAGAVVTRDVPPWSVVAGVPARVLFDRRDRAGGQGGRPRHRRGALARFDALVADQWPEVLAGVRISGQGRGGLPAYVDHPGAEPTVRAVCDAVEIAAAFGRPEEAGDRQGLVERLRATQDPTTGLIVEPEEGLPEDPFECRPGREYHQYGVLSVGYALELLSSHLAQAVHCVEELPGDELVRRLDALPWRTLAWPSGSWVDFYATAVYMNRRHHGSRRNLETLLGWLGTRADPRTGMWGPPDDAWGWLLPVNAFYRATRGSYAQFGHPLPHPEAAVDTVVAHCRDNGWFAQRNRTACNVLDVVHPLWLCARQSDYRRAELTDPLAALLERTTEHWADGRGFAFATADAPGLQGTEMWLSIVHLLADLLGERDGLSFAPQGVHRLAPVDRAATPL